MNTFLKRLAFVVMAAVPIIAGCSRGDSPTGPGSLHKTATRATASECGEATYLAALSSALPAWEDSIETWQADTELLDHAPAFTGQSTSDYLVALVPVLQQWEGAINTKLAAAVVDTVADFNPTTSSRQHYLTGLSSLFATWKNQLETHRGKAFLPAPPVFVPDTTPPEITCHADTTVTSTDSLVVVNFKVTAVDDCDPAPVVTCVPPSGHSFPVGATMVTCTAKDSLGNESTCSFKVTVGSEGGNTPPVITCHADTTISCAPDSGLVVNFKVTATDDTDPAPVVTCVPPSGSVFHVGKTTVNCTAKDSGGSESTCSFTVTVEAAVPGHIASATANPSVLWPPNHKWVDVRLDVDEEGGCSSGSAVSFKVTRVTSNEDVNGTGDGNTSPDWIITHDGVKLRAERSGNGNGRVYTVHFKGDDGTEGSVHVVVPHDQGGGGGHHK